MCPAVPESVSEVPANNGFTLSVAVMVWVRPVVLRLAEKLPTPLTTSEAPGKDCQRI